MNDARAMSIFTDYCSNHNWRYFMPIEMGLFEGMVKPNKGQGRFLVSLLMALTVVFISLYLLDLSWQSQTSEAHMALPGKVGDDVQIKMPAAGDRQSPHAMPALPTRAVRKSTTGLLKCTSVSGTVMYSDSLKPEDCNGEVEQVGESAAFNIIAAQPSSKANRRPAQTIAVKQYAVRQSTTHQTTLRSTSANLAERCTTTKGRLAKVRSRMRAGYKASQYNRLMDEERSAKAGIAEYCH